MVPTSYRRRHQQQQQQQQQHQRRVTNSAFTPLYSSILLISAYSLCTLGAVTASSQGNDDDVLVWVRAPQPTALMKGDDLILACEVKHLDRINSPSPPASNSLSSPLSSSLLYSWSKDGGPIPAKASTYSNHSLFVPRVGVEDLGRYTCSVTVDGWEGGTSASANVIEAYLDPFIVQPQSQTLNLGQTVVLTCVTGQSAPHLEVYWTKDEERFYDGTQMTAAFGDFDEEGLRLQTSMRLDITASSESTGVYQCVARNKLLNSPVMSIPAKIDMGSVPSNLLPVIEWTLPETLVIAEGQNLTLGCRSQVSTEPVEINWFLGRYLVDESKRVYVLPNASLAFFPVSARDRGVYHCRASNSKGTTKSPEVKLVIAYLLFQFQEEPSDTFALYGQQVVLTCQPPESLPVASVVWYKNYAVFNTTSRPGSRLVDNNLHLGAVTKSDVGNYYCVAVNSMTNPSSRTSRVARLNIEGPPQMTQPPARTRTLKGSLLHLQCLAESDPKPTVTWTFEGRPLTMDDDVTIMNHGQELWISNVGKAWEGDFTCNCSNKYGSISASATVTIIVPPVSLHPIGMLRTTRGSTLRIGCPVDGFPLPSIQWFHNKTSIGEGQLDWSMDGLDLVIERVTPDHSGTYECVATNEGGDVTSAGTLVVFVPPYIVESPQDISVIIDKKGELTCRAGGNEAPSIHWFLNNTLPVGGVLGADNQTLTFPSVRWEDVGVYTCVASNGVGVVKRSAAVSVQVPPTIVSTNQPDGPVKIKSQFILTCGANGLPPPAIKWTRLGLPILPSLNGRIRFPMAGMLVVELAVEDDAGVYECIAESQAGSDTASFSISIFGHPHPPTLLAAVPLSSTSVYLLWEWSRESATASQSKTIDYFRIFYRKKSSGVVESFPERFPPNVTRVEVMPLDPGTAYVFYVKAVNSVGSSEPSNLLTAVTFHDAPSPPTNLRVLELQSKSVVVTWEPPASPNGVVKLYQLRFKRVGVTAAYETINITSPTFPTQETTLQSLRPFYKYTIQTRAATLHDTQELWGNYTSPLIVQTKMTVPSLPPQFVKATAIDANAITVSWEPVPDLGQNGLITGYFILCLDDNKNLVASHRVDKSLDRRSVFGLSPWRQYWVSVKGENLMGIGPESKAVSVRTLPIAPVTIPQRFTAEPHSSSSITLSWKPLPPSSITCEITEYSIRYRSKVEEDDAWLVLHIPSNVTTHILTNLNPWTPYEFSIAASTDSVIPGLGPFTQSIIVSTLQGESSPVIALAFTAHSTSISVSWKPPLDVKGNLVGYSIQYQIVFIDRTAKSKNVSVHTTTCLLTDLLPNTSYRINISPNNEERLGQTKTIIVKTLPLEPSTESVRPAITTDVNANDTSLNTFGSIAFQEENKVQNHVKKNLASIVGGSIVGAIALIIFVIFLCAQCKKYRKKQRLSYDVDGEEGTIQQHKEQTPADQQEQEQEKQAQPTSSTTTTATVTADNASTNNNSSKSTSTPTPTTEAHQTQGDMVDGDESGIDTGSQQQHSTGSSTESGQKLGSADGKSEKSKTSGLRRLSKPSVFQGQGYSKLDEEGGLGEVEPAGTSTPVSVPKKGMKTVSSSASVEGIITSKSAAEDTISIMSDTLKRRSRMRSESAAAIAVLRNSQIVNIDDSDGLIDNEIHTEVIFNERTVL